MTSIRVYKELGLRPGDLLKLNQAGAVWLTEKLNEVAAVFRRGDSVEFGGWDSQGIPRLFVEAGGREHTVQALPEDSHFLGLIMRPLRNKNRSLYTEE